jgi:two-component system phosphate regulon sensor histidine kinase PhoR
MNRLRWLAILMGIVILIITGFQAYWLRDNYSREKNAVEVRTDALFQETVRQVQDSLLVQRWDAVVLKDSAASRLMAGKKFSHPIKVPFPGNPARILSKIGAQIHNDSLAKNGKQSQGVYISLKADGKTANKDSSGKFKVVFDTLSDNVKEVVVLNDNDKEQNTDALVRKRRSPGMMTITESVKRDSGHAPVREINTIFFDNERGDRFKIKIDSLISDSVSIPVLEASFRQVLAEERLDIPFTIHRNKLEIRDDDEFMKRPLFGSVDGYKLQLGNTAPYLVRQLALPALFSFFLVGITVLAFVLLYRNLLKQQRLGQMKNDLISNITHELKTPISTVGVAIEALKNFNAIQDPKRTKEYLDISQNELQRLGLLVDKVLKLSMFEKKEIDLNFELFDLKDVVNEVVTSLRLQIEKCNATVTIQAEGDTTLKGDRLHLLSVVFNLLDNALKYSKENATINLVLKADASNIVMHVSDNGIGIPAVYKEKVFEKFFRVPAGDTHNAKGHGLGLSYSAQVLRQHHGSITVDSSEGVGSTFTIILPKDQNT